MKAAYRVAKKCRQIIVNAFFSPVIYVNCVYLLKPKIVHCWQHIPPPFFCVFGKKLLKQNYWFGISSKCLFFFWALMWKSVWGSISKKKKWTVHIITARLLFANIYFICSPQSIVITFDLKNVLAPHEFPQPNFSFCNENEERKTKIKHL